MRNEYRRIYSQSIPPIETKPFSEKGGVFWYGDSGLNVREVARAMNAVGARFITATTYELPANGGFRLEYHWDLWAVCWASISR